jgi:putative hydrolase of the HAD superfamily
MQIKAVLFDLGETLLNFGKVDTIALFKQAGKLSWNYLKQNNQSVGNLKPYLLKNMLLIRLRIFLSNITGNDFDSLAVLKNHGTRKGYKLTDEQWQQVNHFWYQPLRGKCHLESDIKETLNELRQANLKLGIISNTFVNAVSLDKHLEEEGLIEFFEHRIYSYQYSFRKPDKRIFLAGAEMIGAKPETIIYVGDRIDKDIKGAANAGLKPVMKKAFTNEGKKSLNGVPVIEKISELPALIKKING